jgi:hypothetical protein
MAKFHTDWTCSSTYRDYNTSELQNKPPPTFPSYTWPSTIPHPLRTHTATWWSKKRSIAGINNYCSALSRKESTDWISCFLAGACLRRCGCCCCCFQHCVPTFPIPAKQTLLSSHAHDRIFWKLNGSFYAQLSVWVRRRSVNWLMHEPVTVLQCGFTPA